MIKINLFEPTVMNNDEELKQYIVEVDKKCPVTKMMSKLILMIPLGGSIIFSSKNIYGGTRKMKNSC